MIATDPFDAAVRGLVILRREEPDMSLTACVALLTLSELPKGATVPALDSMLQLEPGTMTRVMQQLLARELIVRQRDRKDRRTHRVHLSTRGKALSHLVRVAIEEVA